MAAGRISDDKFYAWAYGEAVLAINGDAFVSVRRESVGK